MVTVTLRKVVDALHCLPRLWCRLRGTARRSRVKRGTEIMNLKGHCHTAKHGPSHSSYNGPVGGFWHSAQAASERGLTAAPLSCQAIPESPDLNMASW